MQKGAAATTATECLLLAISSNCTLPVARLIKNRTTTIMAKIMHKIQKANRTSFTTLHAHVVLPSGCDEVTTVAPKMSYALWTIAPNILPARRFNERDCGEIGDAMDATVFEGW